MSFLGFIALNDLFCIVIVLFFEPYFKVKLTVLRVYVLSLNPEVEMFLRVTDQFIWFFTTFGLLLIVSYWAHIYFIFFRFQLKLDEISIFDYLWAYDAFFTVKDIDTVSFMMIFVTNWKEIFCFIPNNHGHNHKMILKAWQRNLLNWKFFFVNYEHFIESFGYWLVMFNVFCLRNGLNFIGSALLLIKTINFQEIFLLFSFW